MRNMALLSPVSCLWSRPTTTPGRYLSAINRTEYAILMWLRAPNARQWDASIRNHEGSQHDLSH